MRIDDASPIVGLAMAALVLVCGTTVGVSEASAQGRDAVPRLRTLAPGGESFTIGYPEKDWNLVPGGGVSLIAIAQRRFEAVLVVERTSLQVELSPEDIGEVFLSLETELIRERTPTADDIKADLQELGERRVAAFLYRRTGGLGPERVLQYSMPAGKWLYRIFAVARADMFDRHLPTLQAIALSLNPR